MQLWYVEQIWKEKGQRKSRVGRMVVMAETAELAIECAKDEAHVHKGAQWTAEPYGEPYGGAVVQLGIVFR